jgi:hypothetical protein
VTELDRISLDRILPSTSASPDWDDVMNRSGAHQSRRRRRLVALAAAALVAAGTASASGTVRDFFLGKGFIGLPPQGAVPSQGIVPNQGTVPNRGAVPSTPERGKLVLFYWGPAPGNLDLGHYGVGKSRIWVYADGRLISLREANIPQGANHLLTGFLEQRLTPEGVELLRSEIVAKGLLGPDQHALDSEPVPFGIQIKVRNGNRLVRVDRARDVKRLVARLADPASWLPASAWDDREIRAYVPSRYVVCYGNGEWPPQPIERSRILTLLPAPAAELLRARDSREEGHTYCSDFTTEEARALAKALDDGGQQSGFGDERGPARTSRLEYRFEAPGPSRETIEIFFEPYLPHGEWTCSPCG